MLGREMTANTPQASTDTYFYFGCAGSEIAGEAAAALAAAHLSNASAGDDYLTPAAQLYSFATGPAKGSYMNTSSLGVQIHAALYPSTVFPRLSQAPSCSCTCLLLVIDTK